MAVTHTLLGRLPTTTLAGIAPPNEITGMVASRKHADVYWCHDDNGTDPIIYGFRIPRNNASNTIIEHVKTIRLTGPTFEMSNWEDMAYDEATGSIWVMNSGNTGFIVRSFSGYKFTEPDVLGAAGTLLEVAATRYQFDWNGTTFGGVGINCEAVFCHPTSAGGDVGRLYFVPKMNNVGQTKEDCYLWRAPVTLAAYPTVNSLEQVTQWNQSRFVSAADWSPTGDLIMTRDRSDSTIKTPGTLATDVAWAYAGLSEGGVDESSRPWLPYTSGSFFKGRVENGTTNVALTNEMRSWFTNEYNKTIDEVGYPNYQTQPRDYFDLGGVEDTNGNWWGTPYKFGYAGDPVWTVYGPNLRADMEALIGPGSPGFHAPANLKDWITLTSDSPIMVIDRANGITVFCTEVLPGTGYTLNVQQSASVLYHSSNGLSKLNPAANNPDGWSSRGRISDAMTIRRDLLDWGIANNSDLGHVLHLFWTETLTASGYCHPMHGDENDKNGWGKEGQRLRLSASVNVETLPGLSAGAKVIARTMQRYGIYIGDNAGKGGASIHCDTLNAYTGILTEDDLAPLKINMFEVIEDGYTGTAPQVIITPSFTYIEERDVAVAQTYDGVTISNESLAFTVDGAGIMIASEGLGSEVWYTEFDVTSVPASCAFSAYGSLSVTATLRKRGVAAFSVQSSMTATGTTRGPGSPPVVSGIASFSTMSTLTSTGLVKKKGVAAVSALATITIVTSNDPEDDMDFVPKTNWQNSPSTTTPITAAELIRIENGIAEGAREATESQPGNVELATATEMTIGTDLTRVPSVKRVADYVSAILGGVGSGVYATQAYVLAAISAPFSLIATTASTIPLTIKGAISQSSDLLVFKNSDEAVLAFVDSSGQITAGGTVSAAGMLKAKCRSTSTPAARFQGAVGQQGNMIIVQDSSGANKMTVAADGTVNGTNIGTMPGTTITYSPLMVLDAAETVPAATLAGTIILRRPA